MKKSRPLSHYLAGVILAGLTGFLVASILGWAWMLAVVLAVPVGAVAVFVLQGRQGERASREREEAFAAALFAPVEPDGPEAQAPGTGGLVGSEDGMTRLAALRLQARTDPEGARAPLRALCEAEPRAPGPPGLLAEVALRLGDEAEALRAGQRAVEAGLRLATHTHLRALLETLGPLRERLVLDAPAWRALGRALGRQGTPGLALWAFDRAEAGGVAAAELVRDRLAVAAEAVRREAWAEAVAVLESARAAAAEVDLAAYVADELRVLRRRIERDGAAGET